MDLVRGNHHQTVAGTFPAQDTTQDGFVDKGSVEKVLEPIGMAPYPFTVESYWTASTGFWGSLSVKNEDAATP